MTTSRQRPRIKPGVPAPGMAARIGGTLDERRDVQYQELRSRSLLNRFSGRPMPFGWTVNPYRGCEMGCRYCYARYTHEFLGEADPTAFERRVYVKRAEGSGLLADLQRARRSGRVVALGTATDPYQPAEARFQVTRRVLEAAREVPGIRLSITTKSTLVERDAALLAEIARVSELSVNFSITTTDAALARRLEPRAPRPDLRFGAMSTLAREGVETRLFIMPVLPLITDDEANLGALLAAAGSAGASMAESNVLFLRPGTRETFFAFLAVEFPALVPEYERLYAGSACAARMMIAAIEARVARLARVAGFAARRRCDRADDGGRGRQLPLVW